MTLLGTAAGFLGAFTIALTSALLLPFCAPGTVFNSGTTIWSLQDKLLWVLGITIWGGFGSILDSALGGWFQASVVDVRTGKVVEGAGGKKVYNPIPVMQSRTHNLGPHTRQIQQRPRARKPLRRERE